MYIILFIFCSFKYSVLLVELQIGVLHRSLFDKHLCKKLKTKQKHVH